MECAITIKQTTLQTYFTFLCGSTTNSMFDQLSMVLPDFAIRTLNNLLTVLTLSLCGLNQWYGLYADNTFAYLVQPIKMSFLLTLIL